MGWDLKENLPEPENYTLSRFTFENGETIENLNVEYLTIGKPKYDENNLITNAIIYFHGSSGSASSVKRLSPIVGPNRPLDPENIFIISLSALGSPNSASPSNTLSYKFPQYTIKDMVNFQFQFLKEKFNISHLKGVIGTSMGGFQALQWAVSYPDSLDFLIPIVTSYKVAGLNYAGSKFSTQLITEHPDYKNGKYGDNPIKATKKAAEFEYMFGLSKEHYRLNLTNAEIDKCMEEMAIEGSLDDANDIVWRNKASLSYNLENELEKIKVPTLIMSVKQDQYFPPELDGIPLNEKIVNSKLLILDSTWGHIGTDSMLDYEEDIIQFLEPHIKI